SGVYVGGNTIGIFPGQTAAGESDIDAFVARYDNAGNQLWVRQFGSTTVASDAVTGIAADATGVYAIGWTNGALQGQTNSGSSDIFIRKYDVNGTVLWTRQFGTPEEDVAFAAASDATGVYAGGNEFGDGFVRKYDSNGNMLWERMIATTSTEETRGLAADIS